jgi:hypothetical protein
MSVRQVLRDYLRDEGETLQLMTNDITANVRLLISERFPKQVLRRVVNEITRMCKKVARLGFSEMPTDPDDRTQKLNRGVRVWPLRSSVFQAAVLGAAPHALSLPSLLIGS